MISEHDARLFLDLDKERGPNARPGERMDARLKAAWLQFQALRALALEAAPEPGEKLLREALEACRRRQVEVQLSRLTGDTAAREIMAGQSPRGLPGWLTLALATGVLATVWAAFHFAGSPGMGASHPELARALGANPAPAQSAVPFEFPVATPPVAEALAGPGDQPAASDADDVHAESSAERQAARLLREHLHQAQRRDAEPVERAAKPRAKSKTGRGKTRRARAHPARRPASAAPRPAPAAGPAAGPPVPPALTLSSNELWAAAPTPGELSGTAQTDVALGMPSRQSVDVRLFSPAGRTAVVLASGAFGPGTVHFILTARDGSGRTLDPGTYYLRVMTPWFSRVEPIQIH